MITQKEHEEIVAEYEALIKQAWTKDPSLGRTLEWLRDSYVELWERIKTYETAK